MIIFVSDGILLSEMREDVDDVLSDNSTSNCYYIPPLLNEFGCNYIQKASRLHVFINWFHLSVKFYDGFYDE